MKRLILAIGVLVSLVVGSTPVFAVDAGERINSFDSKVTISRDGTAHVHETIIYDFGPTEHHGIYRDIPIDYHDGQTNYYLTASGGETMDERGAPVERQIIEENGFWRLKLGDPDHTITGSHTYNITYTLSPVVMRKNGHPFLNLDLLGDGWLVPTDTFSASVSLEDGAELTNIAWFGPGNTSLGTLPRASMSSIPVSSAVTINADLPDGYTSTYLEPNKPRPFDLGKFIEANWFHFVFWPLFIGLPLVGFVRWSIAKRRRSHQTVIAQYTPPADMRPADIGLLDEDSMSGRELTATLIQWAVDGYIKITRIEKSGFFGSVDYQLNRLKDGDSLPAEEQGLFGAIFGLSSEVKIKSLSPTVMQAAGQSFRKAVTAKLTEKGYYDAKGNIIEKGVLTELGAKQWALADGLKLYIKVAEKDRLNFTDAPERTPERFSKLLPYAIVLGVEKQWAKQFEGIDVTQATSWYSGNMAGFSAASFATEMGGGLGGIVTTSSSVSSSGGSSGGGAGGGGGGSW